MLNFGRKTLTDYYCVIMERITLTSKPQLFSCMTSRQYSQKFQLSKPNLLHSNVYALREISMLKKARTTTSSQRYSVCFLSFQQRNLN